MIEAPGARLQVVDGGGLGTPVLLAHPATGSAMVWGYQFPALREAGFRPIAWSRRGYAGSEVTPGATDPGIVADVEAIVAALGLQHFHALGSAAGGGVLLDYAMARPRRLLSLVVANSLGNIADPDFRQLSEALRPEPFSKLPDDVRELSPAYRAADPEGTARWRALARAARSGPPTPPPQRASRPGWEALETLRLPILWITGDADLFMPPPLLALFHRHAPRSEMAIMEGAGHSAYWEQPDLFNHVVTAFLRRHDRSPAA